MSIQTQNRSLLLQRLSQRQVWLLSTSLGVSIVALGIVLLVRALRGRQSKIEETQDRIIALMSQLDPIARMQVAQHVVETELNRLPRKSLSKG